MTGPRRTGDHGSSTLHPRSSNRPTASVSLDADDLWAYLRTHGDRTWETRPSYLPHFVPLALDVLDELRLKITFFLVGFDAEREANAGALQAITQRGHEVGNHSFTHDVWLHQYSAAQLDDDLARAEAAITAATGQRPVGFRGPGYSWSTTLLHVLARRGYRYDASSLPTYLGPLARLYFLSTASALSPEERARRGALFGSYRDGLRPVRPYRWELGAEGTLLEIPVTTIPGIKAPFHMSYLLYLARFSTVLMEAYLHTAIAACRLAGVGPSFLLHPLDLLGPEYAPGLSFFPGMDLPAARKRALFRRVFHLLAEHFELVPLGVHAERLHAAGALPLRRPDRDAGPAADALPPTATDATPLRAAAPGVPHATTGRPTAYGDPLS